MAPESRDLKRQYSHRRRAGRARLGHAKTVLGDDGGMGGGWSAEACANKEDELGIRRRARECTRVYDDNARNGVSAAAAAAAIESARPGCRCTYIPIPCTPRRTV